MQSRFLPKASFIYSTIFSASYGTRNIRTVHLSPPLFLILSRANLIQIFTMQIHFSIILPFTPAFSKWSFTPRYNHWISTEELAKRNNNTNLPANLGRCSGLNRYQVQSKSTAKDEDVLACMTKNHNMPYRRNTLFVVR